MSEKFPEDEFDSVSKHGGRHRELRTAKHRFREWLRVFAAAALIAAVGYVGIKIADNNVVFTESLSFGSANSEETKVTVLDGSDLVGAVGEVGEKLLQAGFKLGDVAELVDLDRQPIALVSTSVVALDQSYLEEAAAVAKIIGADVQVALSNEYPGPITVLLGSDYMLATD